MMEYIKLFWEDAPEGEPSVILYEVDTENERLALHSIDIFADGRTRNIPDLYDGAIVPWKRPWTNPTLLSDGLRPPIQHPANRYKLLTPARFLKREIFYFFATKIQPLF